MDYQNYRASRDLSWKILIRERISSLPVRVSDICFRAGITLGKYGANEDLLSQLKLSKLCRESDGFTLKIRGKVFIFYNEKCAPVRQRFTIAHELGHFFLGHKGDFLEGIPYSLRNREPSLSDAEPEMQANVFASRILAPSCVLWGLQIKTAEQIAKICDISLNAAHFRMIRMQQLYHRESQFIKNKGRSCFLQSALERQVYDQFRDFIEEKKIENSGTFFETLPSYE